MSSEIEAVFQHFFFVSQYFFGQQMHVESKASQQFELNQAIMQTSILLIAETEQSVHENVFGTNN